MNLDEFVERTLLDITNGVARAQEKSLLYIAPGRVEGQSWKKSQLVSFEVVVTTGSEAGGGIKIFSLGEAKGGVSSQAVNRISFNVPVFLQAPTSLNSNHYTNTEDGLPDAGTEL